jgi:hypothetical protein
MPAAAETKFWTVRPSIWVAVPLPVGIRGEAHGCIEGGIRGHGTKTLRIQRQERLKSLESIQQQQSCEVEDQHGDGVALPVHLLIRPDAGEPVDEALHRPEDAIQAERPAFVHTRHVGPQRLGEGEEDHDVQDELEHTVRGHEKTSGLSSAITR